MAKRPENWRLHIPLNRQAGRPDPLELVHGVIEGGVEALHGGFGFVAHVREAEGFAFDFAVTAINEDALVLDELLEFGDINDAAAGLGAVIDAGEGDGFIAGFGKEVEAVFFGPFAGELGEGGVAEETGFEAFVEDVVELGGEGVNVADAGGAGGHVLLGVFLEFEEIEVVAAVLDGGGFFEGGGGAGEEGEAGREGEGFLGAGEEEVDAEFIEGNAGGGEGADGIDDEEDVRVFFLELGNVTEGAHDAGGGFVMDEGEGIEFAGGEFGVHLLGEDGAAPIDLEGFGLLAAALGDIEPFVGESAAHAVEDLFGDEVADCSFHDAPGGGGGEINETVGVEELLEAGLDGAIEIFKGLAAVADHGGAEGLESFFADFDRAWDVEFYVWHKRKGRFHKGGRGASRPE